MDVTVLYIEECPHVALLLERLRPLLRERTATLTARVVSSDAEAVTLGMRGSPTLLVDGKDPFPAALDGALSCRLYETEDGPAGLPSVAQLESVLGPEP